MSKMMQLHDDHGVVFMQHQQDEFELVYSAISKEAKEGLRIVLQGKTEHPDYKFWLNQAFYYLVRSKFGNGYRYYPLPLLFSNAQRRYSVAQRKYGTKPPIANWILRKRVEVLELLGLNMEDVNYPPRVNLSKGEVNNVSYQNQIWS